MAGNTVKEMTTNFRKLDKFEGRDFRRWQKKMHFLLATLKVVYVLTTLMPELVKDATVEAIRIRAKSCEIHLNRSTWQRILQVRNSLILGQYTQHSLKMDESISVSSIIDKLPPSWKDFKHTLKHGKDDLSLVQLGSHLRIEESLRAQDSDKGKGKEFDGPSVNMTKRVDVIAWWIDSGATTHVCKDHCWFKTFEPVEDGSVLCMGDEHFAPVHGKGSVALEFSSGKTVTLFNVLYVPKCEYKRVYESNTSRFCIYMSSSSTIVNTSLWHARLEHVHYKRMLEMSKDDLIPAIDENLEKCTTSFYTPQQNGVAERKNRALKEMVNFMLSYSSLSEGFWGEAMVVVRLPDLKRKTLGEKGIDCIFLGYAEHSKANRFYVIEPNDSVSINSIIESRDAIFDENCFSSIPRPKDIIPNVQESQINDHTDDVPSEIPEPRKGKRVRKAKSYGSDFQLYLVEGSRDQVGSQYSYCFSIEEDPRTYNEAMQSRDIAFWKEAIDDEIDSIMKTNTWVLSDLPPGCKPSGCKRIFKRKMKVDGTIDKFKARLTAFLNGDLDEKVSMKQPEGFVMPGNEHKVCKLVKSFYGLKQAPKQWHQKFNEVVMSSGFQLNQSDKCVYSKFDNSGKGVIICLYVDDMLIFGTDQNQVAKTKKFLSSRFSMKDMGEADVILGIKIKHENKRTIITQSHYIEKILKKFNREDCSSVSTPMDPVEKLKPNTAKPIDQLEYSRAIGCLMYARTSTRSNIAYAVGRLSRFTSNPSRQHWKAITRVFKYLRGTKYYGLSYVGYPSVLEGYSDASWINHVEDSSSTSGWVFLLGGGAISWASKK
nr:zinc finger, CCHC-type [Tanacetum cinerariifolium]